ncbi:MAG: peptidoglycan DD-metalloendopeptidase family protein [Bacteroidales bacterium]|nr:peptidoglycan DD-metalloendopeptidase family protein [Bacteroidales bacterium]
MVKKIILIFSTIALLASCGGGPAQKQEEPIPPIGFRANKYQHDSTNVKSGETFPGLMMRLGLSRAEANTLYSRRDTMFNAQRMRAGARVDAYYTPGDSTRTLEYVVYNHSKLKKTVFKCTDSLYMWNYYRPTAIEKKYVDVTIHSSLWVDLLKAGLTEAATGQMVDLLANDIYAWTVNFFNLREGDRFQVIYNQKVSEGEFISLEGIECARYSSGPDGIYALRLNHEGLGKNYFDETGKNLRKAFLKAPLKYNRVSSKFTLHRKHPVTGKVRPHTGVDFAAPAGTPVRAIGDGRVISAGWTTTGGGNVIKIEHNRTYTTGYLHLKGFAKGIKAGARVTQGQIIGYVGNTGVSTGPHLDFRVWKNGTPIDPLAMKSPPADPLPAKYKPELDSLVTLYKGVFDSGKFPAAE